MHRVRCDSRFSMIAPPPPRNVRFPSLVISRDREASDKIFIYLFSFKGTEDGVGLERGGTTPFVHRRTDKRLRGPPTRKCNRKSHPPTRKRRDTDYHEEDAKKKKHRPGRCQSKSTHPDAVLFRQLRG